MAQVVALCAANSFGVREGVFCDGMFSVFRLIYLFVSCQTYSGKGLVLYSPLGDSNARPGARIMTAYLIILWMEGIGGSSLVPALRRFLRLQDSSLWEGSFLCLDMVAW